MAGSRGLNALFDDQLKEGSEQKVAVTVESDTPRIVTVFQRQAQRFAQRYAGESKDSPAFFTA